MNYRRLRLIIFSLFFPIVFFVVGILKALVRYFFVIVIFLLFASDVFAVCTPYSTPIGQSYSENVDKLDWDASCGQTVYSTSGYCWGADRYDSLAVVTTCDANWYSPHPSYPTAKIVGFKYVRWEDYLGQSFLIYWSIPNFSCSDGIKNGDETGVDCGGSCPNVCSDSACPAGKDFVGGCNGTPRYCEGTDVYVNASRFLGFLSDKKTFTYENWIGSNGISYICVTTAILSSGRTMLYINSPAGQEPAFSTNSACVTQSAYNALNNTVCDTSGTTVLNGKNTNIYKSVGSTGLTTLCKNADGTYVNCPGSVSTAMGDGVIITQDPTGVGSTTITSPTGGTNPDGTPTTITQPVTTSGTGSGTAISGLNTGNCYDGIKNGDEITADKGGRCIGITTGGGTGTGTGTGTEPVPVITWSGSYSGGTGSGRAGYDSSSVSDNSELKTLVSGFFDSMKASSFFSMPASLFQSFPSGGSPTISFDGGRYGVHSYNFSLAWVSIIPILKGIIIVAFAAASVKIVAIKGGSG